MIHDTPAFSDLLQYMSLRQLAGIVKKCVPLRVARLWEPRPVGPRLTALRSPPACSCMPGFHFHAAAWSAISHFPSIGAWDIGHNELHLPFENEVRRPNGFAGVACSSIWVRSIQDPWTQTLKVWVQGSVLGTFTVSPRRSLPTEIDGFGCFFLPRARSTCVFQI